MGLGIEMDRRKFISSLGVAPFVAKLWRTTTLTAAPADACTTIRVSGANTLMPGDVFIITSGELYRFGTQSYEVTGDAVSGELPIKPML